MSNRVKNIGRSPRTRDDVMVAYGAGCAWWDDKSRVGKKPSGLPCCPHCGGVLFECEVERWWRDAHTYEAENPGYVPFLRWLQGKCYPDHNAARAAYEAEIDPTSGRSSARRATTMTPSIGRIVHYTLSEHDAAEINRRRQDARAALDWHQENKTGAIVHSGNAVSAGEVYPMIITRTWGDTPESAVNGQVLLDGNDLFWTTSVTQGEGERTWREPVRV